MSQEYLHASWLSELVEICLATLKVKQNQRMIFSNIVPPVTNVRGGNPVIYTFLNKIIDIKMQDFKKEHSAKTVKG